MKKTSVSCFVFLCSVLGASAAIFTVAEFGFNTTGTTATARENWSASNTANTNNSTEISNLQVRAAVGGSETVLTMGYAKQPDVKLYYRGAQINLPTNAIGWDKLEFRIRQISTNMTAPVPFNTNGTITSIAAAGFVLPTISPIPTLSRPLATPPVKVIAQSNEWKIVSYNLTGRTGSFVQGWRMDPIQTSTTGSNSGNFEIDYIKITADDGIPNTTNLLAHVSDQQWDSSGASQPVGQTTCVVGSWPALVNPTGIITVADFNFNTTGSTAAARHNWSAGPTTDSTNGLGFVGLQVKQAVQGTEKVLTTTDLDAADVKLYYRGADLVLPAGASSWGTMEIRIRQTDMTNPVAFSSSGTLVAYGKTGSLFPASGTPALTSAFPTNASGTLTGVPYVVTTESNQWKVFSFNLSGMGTNPILGGNSAWRLDPIQNTNGNFEIDYIKITAIGPVTTGTNLAAGLVAPFWIPDLAGQEILGAELRATLNAPIAASVTNAGNVDVYGVRSDAGDATTATSDYIIGTLLVNDWFALEGGLQGTLSTSNSAALTSWLAGQVGTSGQKYVFLTIRPDATGMPTNYYSVLNTGDAATNRPLLILTLGIPVSASNEWHVAPDAPAGGDGSAGAPLASISDALGVAIAGDEIVLHDGTYHERIEIRSGFPGNEPLVIRAADGARPILSGRQDITGWGLWTNGIYTNQVNFDARDLFVGSMRQRMARWPDVNDPWLQKIATNSSGLTYTGGVPPAVTSTQMYFYGYIPSANSLGFLPVIGVTSNQVVVPASSLSQLYSWNPTRFFLLNAPEFITQPGEWARQTLVGGATKLYFKPNSTADLQRTSSRVRSDIFSIGSGFSANLRISGLTFDGALGNAITLGGVTNVTVEDCVFMNCGNDKVALATGAGAGVAISDSSSIEVRRCLAFLCNLGFGVAKSSDVVIDSCEAGFNDGDGIIISGGLDRYHPTNAFRMTQNIVVTNFYAHHHIYQGHPDNMQYYLGLSNITVVGMLGLDAVQHLMSEEAGVITVSNSVFIGTGARHLICGKNGSLDYDWSISRNTFFGARYSAFGVQILGTAIDRNIFIGNGTRGAYSIDTNRDMYVSDLNLFASEPSSRLQVIAAPTPTPSLYGQESNSVFATESYLARLPGFSASIDGMGLSTRSVLNVPTDQGSKPFYVGDIVEINGDGVQRTVTATNATTITISPQLPEAPFRELIVFNWQTNTNFQLDSRTTASTPQVGGGIPVGSSINIAAYQMGDFNGDGVRDLPTIPVSTLEAWPDPNVYVYPFCKP